MQIKPVTFEQKQSIGIINIDYPPVNALSQSVRQGIIDGLEKFNSDDSVQAVIIRCAQRTFIAGADIKEFGKPPLEPHLPDVVNRIEASDKPVIASLFGTSLGGGFEVALACHYRVASEGTKFGFPEVNLGLIPGAGGTQRLPRVVGTKKSLEMITSGQHYSVDDFKDTKLFDVIFPKQENLDSATIKFVNSLITNNMPITTKVGEQPMIDDVDSWKESILKIEKKARGKNAPIVAAKVIQDSIHLSILEGLALERKAFIKLRDSEQSAALRYAFAAEKSATKTNFNAIPLAVETVGIIGGGTMGSGIVTVFLSSGFNVCLIEQNQQALDLGKEKIETNFAGNVKRGRMTQSQVDSHLNQLTCSTDYQVLSQSDLVIEAVFEHLQVKKEIFSKLDTICKKECILATNTSYLDIDEIASVVSRPEQVIGMHFFSPANIMKLLEVVKAKNSSEQALVTAMAIAKRLKKIPVLVEVCFGFAGNRMYTRYGREVQQMLLEGATVSQIDTALTNWGMAMGPLAVADMSGIDIGYHARSSQPFPEYDKGYFKPSEIMFEQGRYGRKTGSGYYEYDENNKAVIDPAVDQLFQEKAQELNIPQQSFTDEQIVQRALYALISEGLQLLKDGIVQRASDIDVIWLHGYGFPRHKGGPMFQAKQIGKDKLELELNNLRSIEGDKIWPLVELDLIE